MNNAEYLRKSLSNIFFKLSCQETIWQIDPQVKVKDAKDFYQRLKSIILWIFYFHFVKTWINKNPRIQQDPNMVKLEKRKGTKHNNHPDHRKPRQDPPNEGLPRGGGPGPCLLGIILSSLQTTRNKHTLDFCHLLVIISLNFLLWHSIE